jgi:uncharacterized membrane protein YgcG
MTGLASRSFAVVACVLTLLVAVAPASARDFVQDQAGMFSATTVAQLNSRIASFNAQTGKEIVVVTTPSLGDTALQTAANAAFAQQSVNGVLIFIARDDRKDIIVPDRAGAQAGWFTPDVLRSIRTSMEAQFRSESYDAGATGAVSAVLDIYRAHLGSLQRSSTSTTVPAPRASSSWGGFRISMFWWIIIAVVGFLLVRSILRAFSAPRYSGGAPGAAPPPGGYGPSYGPGYGYGGFGGGGSFWSGLLGGLGGAWLGNELFRGGGGIAPASGAQITPDAGGGWSGADSGGWQSDAGQADSSGASGGDWSGGGFGGDAGGGDFGGGDSGGGW